MVWSLYSDLKKHWKSNHIENSMNQWKPNHIENSMNQWKPNHIENSMNQWKPNHIENSMNQNLVVLDSGLKDFIVNWAFQHEHIALI